MKYVTFFNAVSGRPPAGIIQPPTDQALEFADADIRLNRQFLSAAVATELMNELQTKVAWQQDALTLFGKTHMLPRLHQWYGDKGTAYKWSGIEMRPRPWLPALGRLRNAVQSHTNVLFNCVLVNLYRDGKDCMGWHADDEAVLGKQPVIASISLGAERDLLLRRRGSHSKSQCISLNHGSLLIMAGDTQSNWQHALPRRKHMADARINLTFRYISPDSAAWHNRHFDQE
jgi:alkylated DNA repair dioxygenase AlkB